MVRFDDVYQRMHALTKASTGGSLLLLLGAAISLSHPNDVTSLVLAAVLQVITSPVAANMVAATYKTEGGGHRLAEHAQRKGATDSRTAPSSRRRTAPSSDNGPDGGDSRDSRDSRDGGGGGRAERRP